MSSEGTAGLKPWRLDELCQLFEVAAVGEARFRGETIPPRLRPAEGERAVVDGSQEAADVVEQGQVADVQGGGGSRGCHPPGR